MPSIVVMRKLAAPLMLGAVALGAPAMAQTQWGGSSSPDELRYRLDILDAELADIRARLGGTVGSVVPTQPSGGGGAGSGALEGEIQRLTAQVERMQNQINRIQQDLTNRLGDIEFRLTELEGGDVSQVTNQPVGGGVTAFPSGGGGTFGGQQVAAVALAEQGDLDRAIGDVNQGRFDQAEDRLRRFLNDYPSSPLAGDAWYWLGESQFVRGIHAEAARSYLNGYNSDRGGVRAAENLFKLGVTLGRLGQLNEACLTLREVRNQYPNDPSGIVSRADAEADNLTCG